MRVGQKIRREAMPMGKVRDCRLWPDLRRPLALFLGAWLLAAAACAPVTPVPPTFKTPSKVISEAGMEYFVYSLKFPGTSQDLKMQVADSLIWVPLSRVLYLQFLGPEQDNYRQAEIVLLTGEKFKGLVYVSQLIEGDTDVGYWNMSLRDVKQVAMGTE
jgi:hypothetical protein